MDASRVEFVKAGEHATCVRVDRAVTHGSRGRAKIVRGDAETQAAGGGADSLAPGSEGRRPARAKYSRTQAMFFSISATG
jgi:hypothetical protein